MPLYIKRKVKEVGIEDIFLDKLAQKREQEHFVSSKKLEVPLDKNGFFSLLVFGFLIFGFLAGFTFYLQAQGKEKYNSLSQQNKFTNFNLSAERGIIYDRNLLPLVKNESTFELWVKKSELPKENYNQAIIAISSIIQKPAEFIRNLIDSAIQDDFLIAGDLNHEQLVLLTAEQAEFPGFIIKKNILRQYQGPLSMGHILGYLGKISQGEVAVLQSNNYEFADYIGKEGLEKYYENILKEKKGIVKFARTAQGKIISQEVVQYPASGQSLVLSIDAKLQKKSEQALTLALAENGLKKGVVVILDPRNGEMLTSVSWPSFDNNLFANGISIEDFQRLNDDKNNPQLNRVIAGLYPSGSAIKPVMATAALEEGIVNEKTILYCPPKLCAPHQYDQGADCYPDNAYHGYTDVKRAIAESVNPFFYMIGGGYTAPKPSNEYYDPKLPKKFEGLGIMKIAQYLNLFGFGQTANIDLPGEASGRVPAPEWKEAYFKTPATQKWYLGDTYNLSIGQGYFLTTPLQLAQAIMAIANSGKLYQPKIAKEILLDNNQKQAIPPILIRENFVASSTLKIVRTGMRQTVTSPAGSAHSLNVLPIAVSAKTGTAQIYPNKKIYLNWIAVYAPSDNPEMVMVVLIEEVVGLKSTAQRVAREILDWQFYTRNLKEKTPPVLEAPAPLEVSSLTGSTTPETISTTTTATTTESAPFSTTTISH